MHYSFFTSFTHQIFNRASEKLEKTQLALLKQTQSLLQPGFYTQPFEMQIDAITSQLNNMFIEVCRECMAILPPPGDYNHLYVEELISVIQGPHEISLRGRISRVYLHCIERGVSRDETAICIIQAAKTFIHQYSPMPAASELSFTVFSRCEKRETTLPHSPFSIAHT